MTKSITEEYFSFRPFGRELKIDKNSKMSKTIKKTTSLLQKNGQKMSK